MTITVILYSIFDTPDREIDNPPKDIVVDCTIREPAKNWTTGYQMNETQLKATASNLIFCDPEKQAIGATHRQNWGE